MSIDKIANRDSRGYVQNREEFIGSNLLAYDTASTTGTNLYVVHSYGDHFPIYIAEEHEGLVNWYGNKDKWGQTTSRHQSQANPHEESMVWFETADMIVIAKQGITGLMATGSRNINTYTTRY